MKKLYTFFALAIFSIATMAQSAVGILEGNDVQAGILSNGLIGRDAPFLVPAADGTRPLYSAGLWLGGMTPDNQFRIAAHMYGTAGHDFYPGPLTTDGSASISPETVLEYDQLWIVNAADISLHIEYINCLNDVDCDAASEFPGYTIPPVFMNWPANGDALEGQAQYLAPFIDFNSDGFYDPSTGDHPCTPGDQAMFMIFNDKGGPHMETGGQPLGVEIHMTAFAYDSEPHLDQTIFVHYKLINRGTQTFTEFRITNFADMDIGCSDDDLVGTDVTRNMVYAYNGDDMDENCLGNLGYGEQPPAFGIMVLKGPLMDPDATDNAADSSLPAYNGTGFNDGIADNERHGLSNSMYFDREGPNEMTLPGTGSQFHNYQRSIWKNNVPLTYGGNGYSMDPNAEASRYVYPGQSDPQGAGTNGVPQPPWQEATLDPVSPDPKLLATMGPITLEPGAEQEFLVAYVYARAAEGGAIASVEALQQRADSVRAFAQTIPGIMAEGLPCGPAMTVGIGNKGTEQHALHLYPNPANNSITIDMGRVNDQGDLHIFDTRGALISTQRIDGSTTIDIETLDAGMYYIRIASGSAVRSGLFIKE